MRYTPATEHYIAYCRIALLDADKTLCLGGGDGISGSCWLTRTWDHAWQLTPMRTLHDVARLNNAQGNIVFVGLVIHIQRWR
jgi:hypothetical protein